MTESQYKEYTKIKAEIAPERELLFWCGNRYANKLGFCYHIRAMLRRRKLMLERIGYGAIDSEEYELPRDLQDKLIQVMEDWLSEKEKQLESI